jgi:hypothetical protein
MAYQLLPNANYIKDFLNARKMQEESVANKLKNALLEKYGDREKESSIAEALASSQYKNALTSYVKPEFDLKNSKFQEQLLMDPSLRKSRENNNALAPLRLFLNSIPASQKELILSGSIDQLEPAVKNMLGRIQSMSAISTQNIGQDEVDQEGLMPSGNQEGLIASGNSGDMVIQQPKQTGERDYSNIIIRKEPLTESAQVGLFGVKRQNELNKLYGTSIPVVASPERANSLTIEDQVKNLQDKSNLMNNGLDRNGLSHEERIKLAGQIRENDNVIRDDSVKKKLNSALQIEGLLSDPTTRRIVYNSTLYAGAQGKGKAFIDSLKTSKPETYNDYINYKTILASNLTNLTKQLEQLGATNETRRDINSNFTNSLNMWTSNPEQALTSINEAFREMSILAKNASIAAQPLYPFAKEKAAGIDLNFVPIKMEDVSNLKETKFEGEGYEEGKNKYSSMSDADLEKRIAELSKANK